MRSSRQSKYIEKRTLGRNLEHWLNSQNSQRDFKEAANEIEEKLNIVFWKSSKISRSKGVELSSEINNNH